MQALASVLETLMVICFGISWPLNISKAWKSRTAKGTSVLFYFFIWIGYIFGIIGKLLLIRNAPEQAWYVTVKWYVLFFYFLNTLMVTCGILIYFRNRILDHRSDRALEKADRELHEHAVHEHSGESKKD